MPSVPFGLCIWSSYKLNSKERCSCFANHWWPCFEYSLEEKINLLILQGGSPIEGVIAGDRLAEVVETFSHIRQPWSPNNGRNTGRARIWCQESTFPWNTLGPDVQGFLVDTFWIFIYIVWSFVFSCVHCNASVIEETMVGRRINLVVSAKY